MVHRKRRMHLFDRFTDRDYIFRIFVRQEPSPHFFIVVVKPKTGEVVRKQALPPLLFGGEGGIMPDDQLALEEKVAEIARRLP